MALIHNVEISWTDLMTAFASGATDRVYFLDRITGEIFFVPSAFEDKEFWNQIETHQERFLEIPPIDRATEKKIMGEFVNALTDPELKTMLEHALSGKKPYTKVSDVLSFFPEEQDKLSELKDNYVTVTVKKWLAANDIFTMETSMMLPMPIV